MTYLAHIAGDGRKQTAAEHLNGTAERCALFAAPFGAEELRSEERRVGKECRL